METVTSISSLGGGGRYQEQKQQKNSIVNRLNSNPIHDFGNWNQFHCHYHLNSGCGLWLPPSASSPPNVINPKYHMSRIGKYFDVKMAHSPLLILPPRALLWTG